MDKASDDNTTQWNRLIDTTAFDPDDPEVADEVERRLADGDYNVTGGSPDTEDPQWLLDCRQHWRNIWTVVLGLGLVVVFLLLLFFVVPAYPTIGSIIALVVIVAVCVIVLVPHGIRLPPPTSGLRRRLRREVQLAQMARRNDSVYVAPGNMGSFLYAEERNPVSDKSVLIDRRPGTSLSWTKASLRFLAGESQPYEFGTMRSTQLKTHSSFILGPSRQQEVPIIVGQYVMFRLGRALPHMVLDSRLNNALGSDLPFTVDPRLTLEIDAEFDKAFTTYVPDGAETKATEALNRRVCQALCSVADVYNVETVGDALVFFTSGYTDYANPKVWDKVAELENLVDTVLRPQLGEVGNDSPSPATTEGKYEVLPRAKSPRPDTTTTSPAADGQDLPPTTPGKRYAVVLAVFIVWIAAVIANFFDISPVLHVICLVVVIAGIAAAVTLIVWAVWKVRHRYDTHDQR